MAARPLAARAAAHLVRVSAWTISSIRDRVARNGWKPYALASDSQTATGSGEPEAANEARTSSPQDIMVCLVREAVYTISHGYPDAHYMQSLCRLSMNGVSIGDKFASKSFLQMVEFTGSKLIELMVADSLSTRLPGLGVVSPIAVTFDGVTVGDSLFARNESFQVICVAALSPHTGEIISHFVGCPSIGLQKKGVDQAKLVLQALAAHPAGFHPTGLRRRVLTIVGGDGAVAPGGVDAKHSSTQAANKLEELIYTERNQQGFIEWERFHRADAAFRAALQESEAAQEIYSVAKIMSQKFGSGDGRVLLRSAAEIAGDAHRAAASMTGTRKGEHMVEVAENLHRNFRNYALALHARVIRKRSGQGGNSQADILTAGRRLCSVDFVVFLLCFRVLMESYRAFTLLTQSSSELPWKVERSFQQWQEEARDDEQSLHEVKRFVHVLTLMQHYVDPKSICRFCYVMLSGGRLKRWGTVLRALPPLLLHHQYKGVDLHLLTDLRPGTVCITPRCTCRARRSREDNRRVTVFLGGRAVRVPEWVAHSSITLREARRDLSMAMDEVPLRYQTFAVGPQGHLMGTPNMFRVHLVQCQTARTVPVVAGMIQTGLTAALNFVSKLRVSFSNYWGSVGATPHVQKLYKNMATCWDFPALLADDCVRPREEQMACFVDLAEQFRHRVSDMQYPDQYPYVQKSWPSAAEFQRQYKVFHRILRNNATRPDWRVTVAYEVALVQRVPDRVRELVQHAFASTSLGRENRRLLVLRCVAGKIWGFLHAEDGSLQFGIGLLVTSVCIWGMPFKVLTQCQILNPKP